MNKSNNDDSLGTNMSWSSELENLVKTSGEQANGLAWIHKRSEVLFSYRRNFIELPVIVLSSAVGFCSVGTSTVFAGRTEVAPLVLGCLSLLVSVLNTINSYFAWSKRAEGHRIASVHYARLFRFLHIELSLPRSERMGPSEVLKFMRESIDRLAEISPLVPRTAVEEYRRKFSKQYTSVAHPAEVNGLASITVVRAAVHVTTPRTSNAFNGPHGVSNEVRKDERDVATHGEMRASRRGSRSESFSTARSTGNEVSPAPPVAIGVPPRVSERHESAECMN
jgi:hypothetical protein